MLCLSMKLRIVSGALLILSSVAMPLPAAILSGPLDEVQASIASFAWGDGQQDLYTIWSNHVADQSGFFYGSAFSDSNVDIYVAVGLADPLGVADASVFDYFDSSTPTAVGPQGTSYAVWAQEGDTLFFRGTNGRYGAWSIADIRPDPGNTLGRAALDGTWYYLTDGGSDFTIPEPGVAVLLLSSLLFAGVRRRG